MPNTSMASLLSDTVVSNNKGGSQKGSKSSQPTGNKKADSKSGSASSNKTDSIQGRDRIAPGAAGSIAPRVYEEFIDNSGVLPELFTENIFISKEASLIEEATGWSQRRLVSVGKAASKQTGINKKVGMDLTGGYWYAHKFDRVRNAIAWKVAQYKPMNGAYDPKGKTIKYLSSVNSQGAVYTMRVTRAIIKQTEKTTGVDFPYWDRCNADTVSKLYWDWALDSPDVPVVVTEGIKKALALIGLGFPAIALPGVNNIWDKTAGDAAKSLCKDLQILRRKGKPVHLCFDSDLYDNPQVKKALKTLGKEIQKPLQGEETGCALHVWQWQVVDGKGIDDVLVKCGPEKVSAIADSAPTFIEWESGAVDRSWQQRILEDVIEERCEFYFAEINDQLYLYDHQTGAYEYCPVAKKIVSGALKLVDDPTADAEKGQFANASQAKHVKEVLAYIGMERVAHPNQVDPAGQWCTPEGVLRLETKKNAKGRWSVEIKHSDIAPYTGSATAPVFTSVTSWSYDPSAQSDEIDTFLNFCPDDFKETLLDYLSCSLDPVIAKKSMDRDLRGLILSGEGSNGKDTLRKILSLIHPMRVSGVGLRQIKAHETDQQKFGLNGMNPKTAVNFSSENSSADISGNETLKSLITHDPVVMADKGVNQTTAKITALQMHCTNRQMYLSNPQISILTRIAIMPLPYSFMAQKYIDDMPASKRVGIKPADVRFGDTEWLAANLIPALFNQLVGRFERVLNEGAIDWSPCDAAVQDLISGSDHVKAFLMDEEWLVQTNSEDDFMSNEDVYKLYMKYCASIDRAEIILDGAQHKLKDALPGSTESKFDPLCTTRAALSKRLHKALNTDTVRKRVGGRQIKGVKGVRAAG